MPAVEMIEGAGPSPRMRGHPAISAITSAIVGSIPAYAGAPVIEIGGHAASRVHPRVCGGTPPGSGWRPLTPGPSPRMRGHLSRERLDRGGRGSIPAYAGAPCTTWTQRLQSKVHPRVCGGTAAGGRTIQPCPGPSPRMRGHLRLFRALKPHEGSIPAYAGAPDTASPDRKRFRVHPRVCGGTHLPSRQRSQSAGPSPRMRGHRLFQRIDKLRARSIPAYAGAPEPVWRRRRRHRVHPRVCGGTGDRNRGARGQPGPSPRMRGHRR